VRTSSAKRTFPLHNNCQQLRSPLNESPHAGQDSRRRIEESPEGVSSPWSGGELKNPLKESRRLGQEGK
jgi:hypothetical protein